MPGRLKFVESLEDRRFLSASPVSAPLATDPGNTSALALDLGTIDKIKTVQADTIGTGDTADFFTFTVTQPKTTFSATVKGVGKPGKLVKPTLIVTNAAGTAATDRRPTASKQTLGPGTYFVQVSGQEAGTADYKLTVSTKLYKGKKAATLTSDGGSGDPNGDPNNGGGQTGGTLTGSLAPQSTNPTDTYRFRATQTGTFELPASFAADVVWTCSAENNPNDPAVGGAGLGVGDGTLTVGVTAGVDYVFNIVTTQTATNYSVTLDNSFTNVVKLQDN